MIDYKLDEKPKGITIIEGFPGFGLVSTIAIEFLIDHLDAERIGEFVYDEFTPTVAIHEGELVHPMAIWYDDENDLVILHTTLNPKGREWEVADIILEMADELEADEIISLEGIPSQEEDVGAYTYGNDRLEDLGVQALEESILLGITAALMMKSDDITPLFATAHSKLPDGEAAVKIVEVLSGYLDLEVDTEPLMKKAEDFQEKLQTIMQQSQEAEEKARNRRLNYLG